MAIRAGMEALIARVRDLIGDPHHDKEIFAAQEIQDALDRRRIDVRRLELDERDTIAVGGTASSLDYYAPMGDWETDAVLQYGVGWATLAPATSDWQAGHWTFTTNQEPPVYITGRTYDVYATAADLLERWAAKEPVTALQVAGSQQLSLLKARGRLLLVDQYRRQQRPSIVRLVRSDSA